jgi:glycosyltransferase involved in cell wall biosynthesis
MKNKLIYLQPLLDVPGYKLLTSAITIFIYIYIMESLTVSVIIPTYNRYEMCLAAVRSVLDSTYKNTEIIVIDDCSTDERYQQGELERLAHVVIHLPVNMRKLHGVAAAQGATRQVGIERARGEYIAFLDDDDMFHPDKLQLQISAMQKDPSIGLCCANMYKINYDNSGKYAIIGNYHRPGVLPYIFKKANIHRVNWINNSTVVIKRQILDSCGPFKLGKYEDYDMWLRAMEYTDGIYIDAPLTYYCMHNAKNYRY